MSILKALHKHIKCKPINYGPAVLSLQKAADEKAKVDSGSDEGSSAGDTDSEMSDVEMEEDPKPADGAETSAAGSKKKSKRRNDDEDTEKLVCGPHPLTWQFVLPNCTFDVIGRV